jgi:hypothetical protein
MLEAAMSRAGVMVRLTAERWMHIVEEHSELAGLRQEVLQTIAGAELVHEGVHGELLASRRLESGIALVVVYRETSKADGFIITAFLTRRPDRLARRPQKWPPPT